MKKIILLTTVLFLSSVAIAQNDSIMKNKKSQTTNGKSMDMSKTDGVMRKNGSMMTLKNGKWNTMTSDFVCQDGTRISTSGTVTKKDGTQMMLKEGVYMDTCGKVIPVNDSKTPSDKNNSKSSKDKNIYLVPDNTLKNK